MDRICPSCSSQFTVTAWELSFYQRIAPQFQGDTFAIPAPRLCPACRRQRRLSFRNERKLYHRQCEKSGEKIISIYSPDKPFTVNSNREWWGGGCNPLQYGREIDFSRPFFEQFADLYRTVPKQSLIASNNENCEYVNYVTGCKDCYLLLGWGENSEHCLYGKLLVHCRDCFDVSNADNCELCANCVSIADCYRLFYSQSCKHCRDSYYLKNCVGCSDCFGCINLVNKQFCVLNEQLTKAEYQMRHAQLMTMLREKAETTNAFLAEFALLSERSVHKYYQGMNTYDCSGDYLVNCKNVHQSFDVRDSEDGLHLSDVNEVKSCLDLSYAGKNNTEHCYECVNFTGNHCMFVSLAWFCHDLLYCQDCFNGTHDCFGCTGLVHAEYCILNKQYTRAEYEGLCRRLALHMRETGEWGEFFPAAISPFGYNESLAQEEFPLLEEDAVRQGFNWSRYSSSPKKTKLLPAANLPTSPLDYSEDLLSWSIECSVTNRPYRMNSEELRFYRQNLLPLPNVHPDERHRQRNALKNPRRLHQRKCTECGLDFASTFASQRPELLLCEQCFLGSIH